MTNSLDLIWSKQELLPLLVDAFGHFDAYRSYRPFDWEMDILRAATQIEIIPVWEDFDSTVERVRLLLVNPDILTEAEHEDFGWVRRCVQLCIVIFVRHQMRHGPYQLHSLGRLPHRDYPRPKFLTREDERGYIYGSNLSANRKLAELDPSRWAKPGKNKNNRKASRAKQDMHSSREPAHLCEEEHPPMVLKETNVRWQHPCSIISNSQDSSLAECDTTETRDYLSEYLERIADNMSPSGSPMVAPISLPDGGNNAERQVETLSASIGKLTVQNRVAVPVLKKAPLSQSVKPNHLRGSAMEFTPGVGFHWS